MRSPGYAPQPARPVPKALPCPADAVPQRSPIDHLSRALLDSRERWRDLALIASDIIFETDAAGRICFIYPADALGFEAGILRGVAGASLLAETGGAERFNPFLPGPAETRRRVWLRNAGGEARCYAMSVRKLLSHTGDVEGARGVAQDVTAQDARESALATALRRGELLEHITRQMREEVSPRRMMRTILDALMNALGCGGVVLLNPLPRAPDEALLYTAGTTPPSVLSAMTDPGHFVSKVPLAVRSAENHAILLCPVFTRLGEQIVLALWRDATGRGWDDEDSRLASAIAVVAGVVFEHEAIGRQIELYACSDHLTGLLNRRAFIDEIERRINRSEHDGLPNVLIHVDIDNFRWINDFWGHLTGDDCLRRFGATIRSIFRPTDLIARLGGDEFAVFMDGGDQFTAAERTEHLCCEARLRFFRDLAGQHEPCLGASVGIAYRAPGSGEGIDSLMRRADLALSQIKRNTPGGWLVSQDEATL